jgi:2-oxoglutarate ferredoxin oxidoreductase subunit gamma
MNHEITISGFGGQGALLLGQLIAQAGLEEGRQVSWIPSYGPEMRGGTAYCSVILSGQPIGSPVVYKPTLLVAMNLPSKTRFEPTIRPGGAMILNTSLIREEARRSDVVTLSVPMNDMAATFNNPKGLNIIGFGAVVGMGVVSERAANAAIDKMFGKKFADKPQLLAINQQCFVGGLAAAREQRASLA